MDQGSDSDGYNIKDDFKQPSPAHPVKKQKFFYDDDSDEEEEQQKKEAKKAPVVFKIFKDDHKEQPEMHD